MKTITFHMTLEQFLFLDVCNCMYTNKPNRLDFITVLPIGVRANIHLGGRPSFARMDSVGGGSSRNFPGSIFSGGGVVAEIFRARGGGGSGRIFSVSSSNRP